MENEWITLFRQVRQINPPAAPMMSRLVRPAVSPEKYEDRRTIEIYRAVLRKLFGMQSDPAAESRNPFLFVLYSDGRPSDLADQDHPALSKTVRRGVTRGSADLRLRIVWVEDCYGVGGDPEGEYVPSGGAVLRFTGIRREGADIAVVDGNIHPSGSEPRRFEYVVEKKNGFWMVRSSYHQWIS
jgi:hypothetical protein